MRTRTTAAVIAALFTLALTGCEHTTTATSPSSSSNKKASDEVQTAESAPLPNFTGKGLQSAQDEAQAAGFFTLTSHDALGRDRMQTFDRNWKVCTQEPAAGTHPTDTSINFGTVKLDEDCPAEDAGKADTQAADSASTMADFTGKSVKAVRNDLDSSTSLSVTDASGQDRMVLMESNWQVCTQEPDAGTELEGQPVALTAVKFDESC
ncbi:hypothetical protein [Streptomyces sp. CAU 1734]|uniref:hypothetical protein n=1 Tax=Streptomyces sp. CAU 1734 TaxID=3140360 RepID=UPI003260CB53